MRDNDNGGNGRQISSPVCRPTRNPVLVAVVDGPSIAEVGWKPTAAVSTAAGGCMAASAVAGASITMSSAAGEGPAPPPDTPVCPRSSPSWIVASRSTSISSASGRKSPKSR